jgi:hypothetical protein
MNNSTISASANRHMGDRTDQRGYIAAVDLEVVARRMYWSTVVVKRKCQRNMHETRCALNWTEACEGRSREAVGHIVHGQYLRVVELRLM